MGRSSAGGILAILCLGAALAPTGTGQEGQAELAAVLREALRAPDSDLRNETLRHLASMALRPEYEETLKSLVPDVTDLLQRDRNPLVRREAVRTLAAFPPSEARHALHQALASSDSAVRYEAVRGLGHVGDQSSLAPLGRALSDTAPYVRREALRAVQAIQERLRTGRR